MTFNFPSPKMQACVYTGTPSRSPAPRNNMSSGFDNTRKKTVVSLRAERLRAQIEVTLGFQISTRKWYAYASLQSNAFQRSSSLILTPLPFAISSLLLLSGLPSFSIPPLGFSPYESKTTPRCRSVAVVWAFFFKKSPAEGERESDSFHLGSRNHEFVLIPLRRHAPRVKLFATD